MNISQSLIDRYAAGPSKARIDLAKSLRSDLSRALGANYRVFLQGSYRNNTGLADLNDVDIVALATTVHSTRGGPPATNPVSWDEIFARVERRLNDHYRFLALLERGDKCIKVDTELALDVVPAIYRADPDFDPIEIYSFRERSARDNFPRDHWDNGVEKNKATDGAYKPTVRLFKRWARSAFGDASTAPSFYIECAVHEIGNEKFSSYLPLSFARVAVEIAEWDTSKSISSVAGDKDILGPSEWEPARFEEFGDAVLSAGRLALDAMEASSEAEANRLWKQVFDD